MAAEGIWLNDAAADVQSANIEIHSASSAADAIKIKPTKLINEMATTFP